MDGRTILVMHGVRDGFPEWRFGGAPRKYRQHPRFDKLMISRVSTHACACIVIMLRVGTKCCYCTGYPEPASRTQLPVAPPLCLPSPPILLFPVPNVWFPCSASPQCVSARSPRHGSEPASSGLGGPPPRPPHTASKLYRGKRETYGENSPSLWPTMSSVITTWW